MSGSLFLCLRATELPVTVQIVGTTGNLWQEHNAVLLLAVHHDFQRMVEAHVAYVLRFLDGRHGVQHIGLQDTVARIGVDGEVTHPERCQVLEEVCALRGVYVVVLQSCLDDDTGGRDVRPLDGMPSQ